MVHQAEQFVVFFAVATAVKDAGLDGKGDALQGLHGDGSQAAFLGRGEIEAGVPAAEQAAQRKDDHQHEGDLKPQQTAASHRFRARPQTGPGVRCSPIS